MACKGRLNNLLKIKTLTKFSEITDELTREYATRRSKLNSWVFRGQADKKWSLETNLERQLKEFGLPLQNMLKIERGLLRKFRRHCENYIQNTPDWGNYMEWFALMRHYGAPTRLLDCTYSVFVALFFAVDKADSDFALWAFDTKGIADKALTKLKPKAKSLVKLSPKYDPNLQLAEDFSEVFDSQDEKFIIPMNPYKFNERLVMQQGVFLCPGNISKSFDHNLVSMFDSPEELNENVKKYVFRFSVNLKKKILFYLQRMNMNRATLFPGLEGFAGSLNSFLAFPNITTVMPEDSEYVKNIQSKRISKENK